MCDDPNGCVPPECGYLENIQVPNVFSPNDDGINDLFTVNLINSEPSDFNCIIVNRWGNTVADIQYPNISWDGLSHGKPVVDGVYFYQLNLTRNVCGEIIYKDGFVQVIR